MYISIPDMIRFDVQKDAANCTHFFGFSSTISFAGVIS